MFVKMHHAIADGIAGVATLGALLDTAPGGPAGPARPWTPAPPPAARDLFADSLRRHIDGLGRAFSALAQPVTSARHAMAGWTAIREILAAEPGPRTSLDRVVGPGRNLALIRSDLDLVKKIAHSHGAKVNDVLLAVTAGGLRGLLCYRGEPVDGLVLPVYVPLTLRQPQARAQARGNLIAQIVVPLPIGEPDPGRRLAQIAAQTATRKASSHPSLGAAFRSRATRRVLLKVLDRYPVKVTTADVPGPRRRATSPGPSCSRCSRYCPSSQLCPSASARCLTPGNSTSRPSPTPTPAPTSASSPPAPKANCRHLPRRPGPRQIAASSAEHPRHPKPIVHMDVDGHIFGCHQRPGLPGNEGAVPDLEA
jgi:hypothetical protein